MSGRTAARPSDAGSKPLFTQRNALLTFTQRRLPSRANPLRQAIRGSWKTTIRI